MAVTIAGVALLTIISRVDRTPDADVRLSLVKHRTMPNPLLNPQALVIRIADF